MLTKRIAVWSAFCLMALAAMPAAAAEKPVNISLFPPVALAQPDESVTAFRFNFIYGKNTSVEMLDIGLVNQTTKMSHGLQWGMVNYNEGGLNGLQLGAINYTQGRAEGLQWGTVNYAGRASGLQLAIVNYAEKLEGFQLGVLNIAKAGGTFPAMVIANWKK